MDTEVRKIAEDWENNPRWSGIVRGYTPKDVVKLRPLSHQGSAYLNTSTDYLKDQFQNKAYTVGLGTISGISAVQKVKAGFDGILYVSGWQIAAARNSARESYPDQSIYPVDSGPLLVEEIRNFLQRSDEIERLEQRARFWQLPIIADGEAGFGGIPNTYELMRKFIIAGTSGVHFEDQLSQAKKCGHLGGKVVIPTVEFIEKLKAARLAADVLGTQTFLMARTDANSATFLTSDIDPRDQKFITSDQRTPEGFHQVSGGIESAIARGLSFAPYADMLWCETSKPDLEEAKIFADGIHAKFPGKLLAYNCSPSFNWRKFFPDTGEGNTKLKNFIQDLGKIGYKFPFITLYDYHIFNIAMFERTKNFLNDGMLDFVKHTQDTGHEYSKAGYTAIKHQREAGAGYFDLITEIVSGGASSITALKGSTEQQQF